MGQDSKTRKGRGQSSPADPAPVKRRRRRHRRTTGAGGIFADVYRLLQEVPDEEAPPPPRNGALPPLHRDPEWVESVVNTTVRRAVWLNSKRWGRDRAAAMLRRLRPLGAPTSLAAAQRRQPRSAALPVQTGDCGNSLRIQLMQLMIQGSVSKAAGNLRYRLDQYLIAERREAEAFIDQRRAGEYNARALWDDRGLDYWIEVMSEDGAPTVDVRPADGEDSYIIVGLPSAAWCREREGDLERRTSLRRVFVGQVACHHRQCGEYHDLSFGQLIGRWRHAANKKRRLSLARECQGCSDLASLRRRRAK